MTPEREQEYREEAERMAMLPVEDQRAIIAMHREIASNPKLPKRERTVGIERADTLERHLRRLRRKGRKP